MNQNKDKLSSTDNTLWPLYPPWSSGVGLVGQLEGRCGRYGDCHLQLGERRAIGRTDALWGEILRFVSPSL